MTGLSSSGHCFLERKRTKMKHFVSFQLLCLISSILLITCDSLASNEVTALTTFKEEIYEDPQLFFSDWNNLAGDPCDWSGLSCSQDRDHVLKINISGASLRGFLVPELGQLSFLQELILHANSLIGVIPKEFGLLRNLRILDLGVNQLSGPIPAEIGNLINIVKINLQSNGLTGRLPPQLGNLIHLEELRLDRNKLQGTVPARGNIDFASNVRGTYASDTNLSGLCRSSQLKFVDFSYNFFVGSIPKCLQYLPRSSFQENCLHNINSKQRPVDQCGSKNHPGGDPKHRPESNDVSKHQASSKPVWLLALEIVIGTLIGSLFIVAMVVYFKKFNSKSSIIIPWGSRKSSSGKDHVVVCIDSEILKDVRKFNQQELEEACEDFSNIIGSSPDSLVYKGILKGGPEIAVISLSIKEEHWTGYLELYFTREVAELARLNHENIGKLLGYCTENIPLTRMLVFEYASNGTLYEHLHCMPNGEGCQLTWTRRMKIILGIAKGLKYLHTEFQPPFCISELNSGTVYLKDDFSPKLVDFENWKTILSRSERNSSVIGSRGDIRVPPNSLEARNLDVQGNIYSFGILLLEIVSGRSPYCKDKGCLVDWAKDYLEVPEVMPYVVDSKLKHFKYEDLEVICEVVSLCTFPDPTKNIISMQDLCDMLESGIDTSVSVELKSSSLAWAELALSS